MFSKNDISRTKYVVTNFIITHSLFQTIYCVLFWCLDSDVANHILFLNHQKDKKGKKKKLAEFEISFPSTGEARQRPLWSYQLPFMAFPLSSPVVSRRFSLSSALPITKHRFLHTNSIFRFTHSSGSSILPKLSSNSANNSSLVGSGFTSKTLQFLLYFTM